MKMNIWSVIGIVGTVIGLGGSLISDFADEKKQDEIIDRKINEKMGIKTEEKES